MDGCVMKQVELSCNDGLEEAGIKVFSMFEDFHGGFLFLLFYIYQFIIVFF